MRDELLNGEEFENLLEARVVIDGTCSRAENLAVDATGRVTEALASRCVDDAPAVQMR